MNETRKLTTKTIGKNVTLSLVAQAVSLLIGFLLGLVVPKFIGEYQYAYWRTFVLYVGYVGVLHFGLLDGIVLRYSQYDYDELDKKRIRSQFQALLFFNLFLTFVVSMVALAFCEDVTKKIVILVACGIITKNFFTYTSYTFQITNRINQYALLVIAQRLIYGVIVAVLLLVGVEDFYWDCIAELAGDVISSLAATAFNKGLYFGKSLTVKETLQEVKQNVSSGVILLFANWSAMLLVSGAQMVTGWRWDELVFGKLSFAFSLTNLFLTFVVAIGVVLFPALKRLDPNELPSFYTKIRKVLSPLLLVALALYFPACAILEKWLPKYTSSLAYLGVMLPLVVYSSKVSLLTNNYLKAYRKEKTMLFINLLSAAFGVVAFLLCAYVFDSLKALLVCIVLTIALNSVWSEIVVMKVMKVRIVKDFILELTVSIGFIACVWAFSRWIALLSYCGVLAVYFLCNYQQVLELVKRLKSRRRKE